jgi:hypothetical protein
MEDEMTALKSLTFTSLPKPSVNPTLDRRTKIIARLEEQKRLLADATYMRSVRVLQKDDSGEANRVREGEKRNCGAFSRQAPIDYRHRDCGGSKWRARYTVGAGECANEAAEPQASVLKSERDSFQSCPFSNYLCD